MLLTISMGFIPFYNIVNGVSVAMIVAFGMFETFLLIRSATSWEI